MSLRALAPSNPCALRPAIRTDATAKHLIGRKCSSVTNSRRAWCDLQRPSVRQNDRHVLAFDVAGFVEAFAKRDRITRVDLGRPVSDKPNTGSAGCCARAASGHAATAPPISEMNSRRFTRSPRPQWRAALAG